MPVNPASKQARQLALRVRHIDVHQKEVGELGGEHAALAVVLRLADAARDIQRAHLGENGRAGIALLLGRVPMGCVSRRPELLDLIRIAARFLEAEHVRTLGGKVIEEVKKEKEEEKLRQDVWTAELSACWQHPAVQDALQISAARY